jgi:hypothetical protein
VGKPLALPNVGNDTIIRKAHELYGAIREVEAASRALAETRKVVAEAGVDPGILADVLKEATADPHERAMRDRQLAATVSALRVPTLRYEVGYGDLLEEEPPEESEADKLARIRDEGFWCFVTHIGVERSPYVGEEGNAWTEGWVAAQRIVEGEF